MDLFSEKNSAGDRDCTSPAAFLGLGFALGFALGFVVAGFALGFFLLEAEETGEIEEESSFRFPAADILTEHEQVLLVPV